MYKLLASRMKRVDFNLKTAFETVDFMILSLPHCNWACLAIIKTYISVLCLPFFVVDNFELNA